MEGRGDGGDHAGRCPVGYSQFLGSLATAVAGCPSRRISRKSLTRGPRLSTPALRRVIENEVAGRRCLRSSLFRVAVFLPIRHGETIMSDLETIGSKFES